MIGLNLLFNQKKKRRRIKKLLCGALLVLSLFLLLGLLPAGQTVRGNGEAGADDKSGKDALNESIYEQIGKLDLEDLQQYLNGLGGFDDKSIAERLISYIGGDEIAYGDFFTQLKSVFFKDIKEMLPVFATVGAVALLGGVFTAIRSSSGAQSTENVTFLVTFSAVLLPVLTTVTACFTAAKSALDSVEKQIQLIFPVLLTLMSVSGKTATAAVYTPAAAFVATGAVSLVRRVLFPASVAIAAFSVAGNLSPQLKINRFGAFFKSVYKWLIGIMISVFGIFFTAQGLGAAAYDNAARRAAKYAIGAGVPIVGGFLSGGFDLALAGSALIKNSVGYLGMLLLLAFGDADFGKRAFKIHRRRYAAARRSAHFRFSRRNRRQRELLSCGRSDDGVHVFRDAAALRVLFGGDDMSEYLFVVSGTVIIAAILTAIAPEGKISGVVKTAVKLVCLIVIAEPIAKYFVLSGKGEEPTFYDKNIFDETVITVDEDFIKYCSELRIAETEKAIEAVLADEYDLTASVTISWRTEEDGRIGILGISVETPAPAEKNVREKIERELGEKYGTTITFGTEKQAKKNDGESSREETARRAQIA